MAAALATAAGTPGSELQPSFTSCEACAAVGGGLDVTAMNPVPALVVDVVDAAGLEQAATAQPEMPKITSAPNCFRRRAINTPEVSQIATLNAPVASPQSVGRGQSIFRCNSPKNGAEGRWLERLLPSWSAVFRGAALAMSGSFTMVHLHATTSLVQCSCVYAPVRIDHSSVLEVGVSGRSPAVSSSMPQRRGRPPGDASPVLAWTVTPADPSPTPGSAPQGERCDGSRPRT